MSSTLGRTFAIAMVTIAALTACSSGEPTATGPEQVAEQYECTDLHEIDTDEMFVQDAYECQIDGERARVLTFSDKEARDNFEKIATQMGGEYETPTDTILVEMP